MAENTFKKLADKWQAKWEEGKLFEVTEDKKEKFYVLEMYPYPSASGLHMGHAFNYVIGDIYSRYKLMKGFNVLHPMGFDSFGLPAENAAIKEKKHPEEFTEKAIKNFVLQQKQLGLTYDWTRNLKSHDPAYYKWNQYFFLKFYEKGLAYKKKAPVNWCPECNTVLANEQVHDGKCWRHKETEVVVKHLEQWFVKTTAYAEELLEMVNGLDWPERIKSMQKNWIGRSEGAEITFTINGKPWKIFTTRPDTLFGVTFMVVSAQHPELPSLVTKEQKAEVEKLVKKIHTTKQEDMDLLEKEGVFTGSYAEHPLTKEKIPVYAGNFVLADYGSGMVMAVPAHDQRDYEFAKKYEIPIKVVVQPEKQGKELKEAYTGEGKLVNSDKFNGLENIKAKKQIVSELEKQGLGKKSVSYKLKDWLVSRQRFWGTPIPIVYCEKCGAQPVPEKELPVKLPEKVVLGEGNALQKNSEFLKANCPKCKGNARRETDTMDTFFDSSWYYLRFTDANNAEEAFAKDKVNYWMPVDFYTGGAEHACMHLIYARFFTKALRDLGFLKVDEPFKKLFNQGMIHGKDGHVMSKSRGNVVNPTEFMESKGTDPLRFFLVSVASPDKDLMWSDAGVEGSYKFLSRVISHSENVKLGKTSKRAESKSHQSIKKITENIEQLKYNLAVIALRELFEAIQEEEISKEDYLSFVKLLTPFTPHLAEEIWEKHGGKGFVSKAEWPVHDDKKIDLKQEYLEEVNENLRRDIIDLLRLVKIEKPSEIKIVTSKKWKYDFVKKYKELIREKRDYKHVMQGVMNSDLKKHGKEATKIITLFFKDASRIPKQELSAEEEKNNYDSYKEKLGDEFNCKVLVEEGDSSKEAKADNALPGKPAIIVK